MVSDAELRLGLSTPGDWITVDPGELAGRDLLPGIEELGELRDQVEDALSRSAEDARRAGVVLSAVVVHLDREAPLLANLVVSVRAAPEADGGDATEEPGSAPAAMGGRADASRREEPVQLPAGPAVRVARLVDLPLGGTDASMTWLSVQYALLVVELGQVVILHFASPSVAAHEELLPLFHEIAETLELAVSA